MFNICYKNPSSSSPEPWTWKILAPDFSVIDLLNQDKRLSMRIGDDSPRQRVRCAAGRNAGNQWNWIAGYCNDPFDMILQCWQLKVRKTVLSMLPVTILFARDSKKLVTVDNKSGEDQMRVESPKKSDLVWDTKSGNERNWSGKRKSDLMELRGANGVPFWSCLSEFPNVSALPEILRRGLGSTSSHPH